MAIFHAQVQPLSGILGISPLVACDYATLIAGAHATRSAAAWRLRPTQDMLNHSIFVSADEEELGFALINLPSTEDAVRWNGKFARVCAKRISESCYVMKFNGESGPEYHQVKWGVPMRLNRLSPRWIPAGHSFRDPSMAIQSAAVDLSDFLNVIEHPLPKPYPN